MPIKKNLNVNYANNSNANYSVNVDLSKAIYADSELATTHIHKKISHKYADSELLTTYIQQKIAYKYAENRIISDFKSYIDETYDSHYKTENDVQAFDAWIALGEATPTFRNTALKYLWRYGKKNGSNKDDLMKTLHYTLMCLYNDHYKDVN